MLQKKEDLRIRKTKQNIKETFLTLLDEKSLDTMHVQEILDLAQINRATFYKYYHDKYDLAEQMVQECMGTITLLVGKRFDEKMTNSEIHAVIYDVYNYIKANRRTVLALWENEGTSIHFYRDMETLLRSLCLERLNNDTSDTPDFKDYLATIYATLVMTTIKWHLEKNRELNIESMFTYVRLATQKILL